MNEQVLLFLDGQEAACQKIYELTRPQQSLRLVVIYFCQGTQSMSLDFQIRHLAPDTHSELYVYGILKDQAQKTCHLDITFARGSAGSTGVEREEVFLLSPQAQNFSSPTIHCSEKSVHGSHGASVGYLDPAQLHYLVSRGLSRSSAETILIKAKLYQALSRISSPKTQKSVKNSLDKVEW